MEIDLVDPLAAGVEALKLGRMAVGETGKFARFVRPPESAELGKPLPYRIREPGRRGVQQRIGFEEIDAAVGRRLIDDLVRFPGRH